MTDYPACFALGPTTLPEGPFNAVVHDPLRGPRIFGLCPQSGLGERIAAPIRRSSAPATRNDTNMPTDLFISHVDAIGSNLDYAHAWYSFEAWS